MRIHLIYIVSFVEKSLPFEWVIKNLDKKTYRLSFIVMGKNGTSFTNFLSDNDIPVYHLPFTGRRDIFSVFLKVVRLLKKHKPDIVHAHLFDAGRISMPAAWLCRIRKRIYTRHYSTFHLDYFPKAVIFDRLINLCSTHVIAISQVVAKVLIERERVSERKIRVIPHGFEFSYFSKTDSDIVHAKKKYKIDSKNRPVIGVISRYTQLKGIEYVIQAFSELRTRFPSAHLVLANADGDYKKMIQTTLKSMLPDDAYTEILFEEDVRLLYAMFDVFVHVPIDGECEAFGQTYVEALGMRVPSVFTLSGIANEFIKSGQDALVVKHKNADEIFKALLRLVEDRELVLRLTENGYRSVTDRFQITTMVKKLNEIYL